jgi:hypothetical protein
MRRLPWTIVLGAAAILFHRALLGEVFFWGLPALQFIPWRLTAVDMLREGVLPLWNPLNGAGAPLFANYQTALLYPFSWLSIVLPVPGAMTLSAILHLIIAAAGMAAFTRALGLPVIGRAVSVLAFALSGYLVARLGTFPIIQAAAWLPWLLWAVLRLSERVTGRRAGWLALFSAMLLLAGHAQTAWYALLLTGVFAVFSMLAHGRRSAWRLVVMAGAVCLGAAVAGLQLFGTAELLAQSSRADGVDRAFALNFSYAPARTLNWIAPNIFGTPANGTYLTGGAYFEDAVYIGFIPLIAALAALIGGLRRADAPRSRLLFWLAIAVIGFVLALGVYTPIFPFLFDHVPTFDLFQAPVRWHIWTVTALSVLAGYGAAWWGRDRRTRRWTRRLLTGAVAVLLLALAAPALLAVQSREFGLLLGGVVSAALLAIAAGLLTLVQPSPESARRPWWEMTVIAVIALDLVIAGWGLNPTTAPDFYAPRPVERAEGRAYRDAAALEQVQFQEFLRFDSYQVVTARRDDYRASLIPNLNLLDDAPMFNNFDPLVPGRYLDYLALIEGEPHVGLLKGAGIGWTIGGDRDRQRQFAPRAWLVGDACWHPDHADLVRALADPAWNPYEQVHILGDRGCIVNEASTVGMLALMSDSSLESAWLVSADRDAWLVLADTWYPGWTASVNGVDAPIYPANIAFRAVQVPPGESRVVLRYAPGWIVPGALVSVVGLIGLLLLFRLNDLPVREES